MTQAAVHSLSGSRKQLWGFVLGLQVPAAHCASVAQKYVAASVTRAAVMDRELLWVEVSRVALSLPWSFSLSFERINTSMAGPLPESCLYHCRAAMDVL